MQSRQMDSKTWALPCYCRRLQVWAEASGNLDMHSESFLCVQREAGRGGGSSRERQWN